MSATAPVKETAKKPAAKAPGQKKTITIRLVKGRIATIPNHRATLKGLGLKHRNQEKTLENTPAVRGMIKRVLHLIEIVAETR